MLCGYRHRPGTEVSSKCLYILFVYIKKTKHCLQKGAGRVAFSSQQSYIAAISARFVQLQHADIEKRVSVSSEVLLDRR